MKGIDQIYNLHSVFRLNAFASLLLLFWSFDCCLQAWQVCCTYSTAYSYTDSWRIMQRVMRQTMKGDDTKEDVGMTRNEMLVSTKITNDFGSKLSRISIYNNKNKVNIHQWSRQRMCCEDNETRGHYSSTTSFCFRSVPSCVSKSQFLCSRGNIPAKCCPDLSLDIIMCTLIMSSDRKMTPISNLSVTLPS